MSKAVPVVLKESCDVLLAKYLELNSVDLRPPKSKRRDIRFADIADVHKAKAALKPGDHIVIPIRASGASHHLMFMGDGTVVDANPNLPSQENCVQRRSWKEVVKEYYDPQVIVSVLRYADDRYGNRRRRALERAELLTTPTLPIPYMLYGINCEVVATFCWTGTWRVSQQVMMVAGPLLWTVYKILARIFSSFLSFVKCFFN